MTRRPLLMPSRRPRRAQRTAGAEAVGEFGMEGGEFGHAGVDGLSRLPKG
ncbi:hypothetical protein [Streptomyces sp. NPDC058295]